MLKTIMKKLGWMGLACLLITQMSMPVMAQPLQGIDPDRSGSIRIHRFAGSTAASPTTGTPLNGIPYTVTRVRLIEGTPSTPDDLRNPENFEAITGAGAHTQTQSTVNGVAAFLDLPQGIYLVVEENHSVTPVGDRVAPFIVGIPRSVTGETGVSEWIYDVDVYPKTDEDTPAVFDKELDLVWDEEIGEMVAIWQLETTIPRLIGNATRFEFLDELNAKLTFISGSVIGTFYQLEEDDGMLTQVATNLPTSAFSVNLDENNVLSIALTQSGFDLLSQSAILSPDPFGTLTFTFRTRISTEEADLGPITNSATLYYNEDEDGIYTTTPPPIDYHFAMEIEKIDVNGDLLSEATFEIFFDEAATEPAFLVNGINRQFTTTNGVIYIPGLQAGTLYLQEVTSPAGYRLITDTMRITIGEEQANPNRPFVITLQVVNEVEGGFILPETGGVGTIMFTIGGVVLVGLAFALAAIVKHRRELNE